MPRLSPKIIAGKDPHALKIQPPLRKTICFRTENLRDCIFLPLAFPRRLKPILGQVAQRHG